MAECFHFGNSRAIPVLRSRSSFVGVGRPAESFSLAAHIYHAPVTSEVTIVAPGLRNISCRADDLILPVAPDGILAHVRALPENEERQELVEASFVGDFSHETAHVVAEPGLP
jgi:hypothetical protein